MSDTKYTVTFRMAQRGDICVEEQTFRYTQYM